MHARQALLTVKPYPYIVNVVRIGFVKPIYIFVDPFRLVYLCSGETICIRQQFCHTQQHSDDIDRTYMHKYTFTQLCIFFETSTLIKLFSQISKVPVIVNKSVFLE